MAYMMEYITVKEMEEALKETKTVIVPVGVVEQHGYHLPLCTDVIIVKEILERVGDRVNAVFAPALPYSYSGGELTGTININPHIFSLFVADLCMELTRMGFQNIVIFLGHGGTDNTMTLKNSLKMIFKKNTHLRDKTISLVECWELSPTWLTYINGGQEHEFHACRIETSLMMYWRPDLVGEIVKDDPEIVKMMMSDQDWFEKLEKDIDHKFIVPKPIQREEIKIGVMGYPEKASYELGSIVSKEMEDGFVAYINLLNEYGR